MLKVKVRPFAQVSQENCCATVNVSVVQQFIYLLYMLSLFLIVLPVSMVAVLGKKELLWQLKGRFSSKCERSASFSILEPFES